ncbi:response regulator containing a CheY-like receiver domain and an HD-GYP domain [Rivularia sp. PCC 7116]|uniref:response regulator n=1 Tax=Rivularia sp. PCC 7116 TaxID=373994 RepID=UPI00029F047F|nr:two-component system response regulator [Rivularia sp. PCC 7116]AFY53129.1 response regulator containing a CheY-like receiver domain and an HD-GYP domain [Rivularia sp. PCC 7116]
MIQWKSNYTGSTELKVAGSNPTNRYNRVGKNHALPTESERHSSELSTHDLKVQQTDSEDSSNYGLKNTNSNLLFSATLQNKEYSLDCFENDVPKVLVVDDHAASRMTAVALLGMEGYEVIEAESGSVAVHLVSEKQPDLILLDVMMPEMDGFEVCQLLKQDEQTRLIPVIFITALNDRRSRIRGIEVGADDFLSKPFDRVELAARVKSLVRQKRLNEDLDHAEKALFSIARAIESRDPNTGDHCERLVNLGKAFGEYLGLSRNQVRDLMWGGYLHDIGKVGISDSVLLKKGKLTPAEWEEMRQHVLIGEQICQPLRSMRGVIPIIRSHHERWDGSGYPDGLKENEIPLLAQVFQMIDIYDALTSERPYKKAFTPTEALSIMMEETDKGWRDKKLMQQFTEFISTINHS